MYTNLLNVQKPPLGIRGVVAIILGFIVWQVAEYFVAPYQSSVAEMYEFCKSLPTNSYYQEVIAASRAHQFKPDKVKDGHVLIRGGNSHGRYYCELKFDNLKLKSSEFVSDFKYP